MKPRACWYCDGTVHFDSDEIGDCDSCGETYSASEFRENDQRVTEELPTEPKIGIILPEFDFEGDVIDINVLL